MLADLGIDYRYPAEVYRSGPVEAGRASYGGIFHFVGTLVTGDREGEDDMGEGFSYFIHGNASVVPKVFGSQPVVQLEFNAKVPWVLSEPSVD